MKYIKKFENKDFNVNTYIKLTDNQRIEHVYKIAKIINVSFPDDSYTIEVITNYKIRIKKLKMDSDYIERKATDTEIEDYEALKVSLKYNL